MTSNAKPARLTTEQRLSNLEVRSRSLESRVSELEDDDDGPETIEVEVPASIDRDEVAHEVVSDWLLRQVALGRISTEGRITVGRLLEDLS